MNFEHIIPDLQKGIKPDCSICQKKQAAFVYHPLAENFVCGNCYLEIEQKTKKALQKLVLEKK